MKVHRDVWQLPEYTELSYSVKRWDHATTATPSCMTTFSSPSTTLTVTAITYVPPASSNILYPDSSLIFPTHFINDPSGQSHSSILILQYFHSSVKPFLSWASTWRGRHCTSLYVSIFVAVNPVHELHRSHAVTSWWPLMHSHKSLIVSLVNYGTLLDRRRWKVCLIIM